MIEKINKWLPILTALAVVVMAVMLVGGNSQPESLGATRFGHGIALTGASDTFTLGASGTEFSMLQKTTASSCTASSSVAASSYANLECAVTGVLSTDTVLMSPGAAASNVSLAVTGVFASSTADGYVRYLITNASTSAITSAQNDVRNVDLFIVR